jgi:ribonucleoside-diphosphate reductase alpha chain
MSIFMKDQGIPCEDDVNNPSTWVFSFPMRSPDHAIVNTDGSALEQLQRWKAFNDHWCDHKPSCSVYYKDEDMFDVAAWVWRNFDDASGVSFFPSSDHIYQQAPYEAITPEKYHELAAAMPVVDWSAFRETTDQTVASQTLACTSGSCEL